MGSRGLKNIPKYSKRFQDTPMITKKLKNSCAKSIMHSKRLLELKKLMAPPPPPPNPPPKESKTKRRPRCLGA